MYGRCRAGRAAARRAPTRTALLTLIELCMCVCVCVCARRCACSHGTAQATRRRTRAALAVPAYTQPDVPDTRRRRHRQAAVVQQPRGLAASVSPLHAARPPAAHRRQSRPNRRILDLASLLLRCRGNGEVQQLSAAAAGLTVKKTVSRCELQADCRFSSGMHRL